MPSSVEHLSIIVGLVLLQLLIRSLTISALTFNLPPLVTLNQCVILAFCGLIFNLLLKADQPVVYDFRSDNSKVQNIALGLPNGKSN